MRRLALLATSALLAGQLASAPPAAAYVSTTIEFGFPTDGVAEIQAAGADLGYGSFWVGHWMHQYGWNGLRQALDTAKANNVAPMIQWYYWGGHISPTCVENENPSLCGGKTKTDWFAMAQTLANEIDAKMQGAHSVVVIETEFTNNGVSNYGAFDDDLAAQADIFQAKGIKTVVGFGEWADSTVHQRFDLAVNSADYVGTQILFSCIRQNRANTAETDYREAVERILTNAASFKSLYPSKPVFVSDFSTASFSEALSGDPEYTASDPNEQCRQDADYALEQEAETQDLFARAADLKANGVIAVVFRTLYDKANHDPDADYHMIAERWFGFKHNGVVKPAYDDVVNGIKNENGGTCCTGGPEEWRQEAEAFASRPVGGSGTSSTASGGAFWNIWANGAISTTLSATTAGSKRLTVVALGDPAGGVWPIMEVRVDGNLVATHTVGLDVWTPYTTTVNLSSGNHTLEVRYTNDGSVSGNDRNLLVDYAKSEIVSTSSWSREAESFTTKTTGGQGTSASASGGLFWNLWANGHVENAMTVPYTGNHDLQITARGAVAGGVWPNMNVYVDGVLVASQTVATATWTTYSFPRTISGGTRTLRISFTNDAIVGTEDRNLHLDVAKLFS